MASMGIFINEYEIYLIGVKIEQQRRKYTK